MTRPPIELAASMAVVLAMSAWYGFAARFGTPSPGGSFGHALGVIGFALMLVAEVGYPMRKRRRDAAWGPTRYWLQGHVFAGLVGPWLVLLHSAGRFQGIAGFTAFLTILIVASGFVGRFIYTATPRSLDGVADDLDRLEGKLARLETQLPGLGIDPTASEWSLATETPPRGWWIVVARSMLVRRKRRAIRSALTALRLSPESIARLEPILVEHYRLWLQAHSLVAARKILAGWQMVHVPLAAALFVMAFLHVGGALYYSTFLR